MIVTVFYLGFDVSQISPIGFFDKGLLQHACVHLFNVSDVLFRIAYKFGYQVLPICFRLYFRHIKTVAVSNLKVASFIMTLVSLTALRGMTKSAAIDLARKKIRVNSVHPGPIDTEMLSIRTPEQNAARIKAVPLKRNGSAEEVAQLVLFLLSDESAYITGAEVAIDGGITA